MTPETRRLEVLIDGVPQGYVHLGLNGDFKITKLTGNVKKINYMLLNKNACYVGFDFKSYERALRGGLTKRLSPSEIEVKESPLPKNMEKLYGKFLRKTGRL